MKTFEEFLTEVDGGMPPAGGDPLGGAGGLPGGGPLGGGGGLPGGNPLGGMGGGPLGGGGGGLGMGGPPGGMPSGQKPPMELRPSSVWDVLDAILNGKEIEDESEDKPEDKSKNAEEPDFSLS